MEFTVTFTRSQTQQIARHSVFFFFDFVPFCLFFSPFFFVFNSVAIFLALIILSNLGIVLAFFFFCKYYYDLPPPPHHHHHHHYRRGQPVLLLLLTLHICLISHFFPYWIRCLSPGAVFDSNFVNTDCRIISSQNIELIFFVRNNTSSGNYLDLVCDCLTRFRCLDSRVLSFFKDLITQTSMKFKLNLAFVYEQQYIGSVWCPLSLSCPGWCDSV